MSEQRHTPLPWAWEPYEGGKFKTERPTIFHVGDVRVVGDGDGRRGYDDHSPDEDDAAFIVLAVNSHQALVDALASCVRILPHYVERGEFVENDEECQAVLEVARETLAAARGESQ